MTERPEPPAAARAAVASPSAGRWRRRLARWRWPFVGLLAVLAALWIFGLVQPLAGLIVVVAVSGLVLAGERRQAARSTAHAAGPDAAAPDGATRRFAEALPDPCLVLDRRGLVLQANALATTAFGLRQGDWLTDRIRAPDLLAAFDRVGGGGPAETVEFIERVPTERWFAAWFAPLGRDGSETVLILDDFTERRRADRVRVDFVANASHELRTPLASLAGFIETLQGPARDDAAARERFLSIMHDQATRMSRLINDLLSLSRIEMKAHLRPSAPVDLVALAADLCDELVPLATASGVVVERDLPDQPVTVLGDRDELHQVLQNLIENACHYGASGGRVRVAVAPPARPGGEAVLTVRDFGPGIAAEHLPRLTERFYRADGEGHRPRGTGLGLAIVKHIVNRHRGRLTIDSRPGLGAIFSITLPATETPEQGDNALKPGG